MAARYHLDNQVNRSHICKKDETEVLLSDEKRLEGDLNTYRHWNKDTKSYEDCPKNGKHENFIPVANFDLSHLPEGFRKLDLYYTVKALEKLTVKIEVKTLSDARPANDDTKIRKQQQGENYLGHLGSGWIDISPLFGSSFHRRSCRRCSSCYYGEKYCPCQVCRNSSDPKLEWGVLYVQTAKHVVWDSTEAYGAEISVFYDSEQMRHQIKTLSGIIVEVTEAGDADRCYMKVITHDEDTFSQIHELYKTAQTYYKKTTELFKSVRDKNCMIIISHPHGCNKQVTVGRHVSRKVVEENVFGLSDKEYVYHIYTTPTCGGSSGAPCYIFGDVVDSPVLLPAHRMAYSYVDKTNACGTTLSINLKKQELRNQEIRTKMKLGKR